MTFDVQFLHDPPERRAAADFLVLLQQPIAFGEAFDLAHLDESPPEDMSFQQFADRCALVPVRFR